jgi:hypothetical protein
MEKLPYIKESYWEQILESLKNIKGVYTKKMKTG